MKEKSYNLLLSLGYTKEDAEKIAKAIEEIDDEMEVEIQYGGQPIYYYFVSVE